jgi:hypothetical protein
MTTDVPAAAAAGRPFSVGGLLATVAIGAALGMAGDGPAREIDRPIEALAGEVIRVQPGRALHGLAEQGRRLEAPAIARPDHPAIPDQRGQLAQLADELQDPSGGSVVARPPERVERALDRLRDRLREAEGALVGRDRERAARIVAEVDASLAALVRDRGAEIPAGHVALFVLEERVAVLKRDLVGR